MRRHPTRTAISSSSVNNQVSRGRHEYKCRICRHARRSDIEEAFVNWVSPVRIAKQYSVSRDALYRHAHAVGLFPRRQRNVRAALEKIIEQAGAVEVNAAAVVAAVQAYSKLNAAGQSIDRSETVNLNHLFERMTPGELEAYVKEGTVPSWFSEIMGATPTDSRAS